MKHDYSIGIKLNKGDKAILHALEVVVEGIAKIFGDNCEVVLHSLEDLGHSVIKIENSHVTGRKIGAPVTDLAVELLKRADSLGKDVVGSYFAKTDDGRPLKCVTILIRNSQGKAIGFVCVNIDLTVPLVNFLNGFLPTDSDSTKENIMESFPTSLKDLTFRAVKIVMNDVNIKKRLAPSKKNMMIVLDLYKKGYFDVKGVIDLVAKQMGVSRYTVYNYIREAKAEVGELM